jgi:hypothetical protein
MFYDDFCPEECGIDPRWIDFVSSITYFLFVFMENNGQTLK